MNRRANLLEHAEQRFLEIARALALRPRFVLLDEPAGGLTTAEIDHLAGIVRTIRDELVSGTRGAARATFRLTHAAASLDQSRAKLSVRRAETDARRALPASQWAYVNAREIRLLPEGTKPEPGSLYEFHYPATDPHGDPIPKADGTVAGNTGRHLSELEVGQRFRVVRVLDQSPDFLRYLTETGLKLEAAGVVNANRAESGTITVEIGGRHTTLAHSTADRLLVEMRDHFRDAPLAGGAPRALPPREEALHALLALGYRPQEAQKMLEKAGGEGATTEELIRGALQGAAK